VASLPPELRRLRELLVARDRDTFAWGLELARSLHDPHLFDAMLRGVTWVPPVDGGYGTLVVRGFCHNTRARRREDLVLALLAAAPPESAVASRLLAEITSLRVDRLADPLPGDVIDLAPLRAFVALERLCVRVALEPHDLAALASLPALRELQLHGVLSDLSALSGAASLQRLEVSSRTVTSSGPLRDLPSLRELDIAYCPRLRAIDFVRALTTVEELSIDLQHHGAHPFDLAPLRALTSLRALRIAGDGGALTSLDALADHPSLESLHLQSCAGITTFAPLRTLPALTSLRGTVLPKLDALGLDGITSLRHLHLTDHDEGALRDLDGLCGCDLQTLTVQPASALEDLAALRGSRSLTSLELDAPKLRSLDGLDLATSLQTLTITRASALRSVAPLSPMRSLASLRLDRCGSLTSLDGLDGCVSLTSCELVGGAFTDVTPLKDLTSLALLGLHACASVRDVSALEGLPNLFCLLLAGTRVDPATLPPRLRAVATFTSRLTFAQFHEHAPPRSTPAPVSLSPELRAQWPRVLRLLLADDLELIDRGAALVRAIGDAALYEALLCDVRWSFATAKRPFETLNVHGTHFDVEGADPRLALRAVLALAADAPPACESAATLRETLVALCVASPKPGGPKLPFDLAPLVAFTALRSLALFDVRYVTHADALGRLSGLERFSFSGDVAPTDFDLTGLGRLRELSLRGFSLRHLARLLAAPALQSLTLHEAGLDDRALRLEGHPTLARFELDGEVNGGALSLRDCPALTEVSLGWRSRFEEIDLRGCVSLRHLTIKNAPHLRALRGLEGLVALTTLEVTGAAAWIPTEPLTALTKLTTVQITRSELVDCAPLVAFTHARTLKLFFSERLADTSALAALTSLTALDVSFCAALTRLDGLDALPLKTLFFSASGVRRDALPAALRRFA
jgi:Leucine-rich repeat (LRR) protein